VQLLVGPVDELGAEGLDLGERGLELVDGPFGQITVGRVGRVPLFAVPGNRLADQTRGGGAQGDGQGHNQEAVGGSHRNGLLGKGIGGRRN